MVMAKQLPVGPLILSGVYCNYGSILCPSNNNGIDHEVGEGGPVVLEIDPE